MAFFENGISKLYKSKNGISSTIIHPKLHQLVFIDADEPVDVFQDPNSKSILKLTFEEDVACLINELFVFYSFKMAKIPIRNSRKTVSKTERAHIELEIVDTVFSLVKEVDGVSSKYLSIFGITDCIHLASCLFSLFWYHFFSSQKLRSLLFDFTHNTMKSLKSFEKWVETISSCDSMSNPLILQLEKKETEKSQLQNFFAILISQNDLVLNYGKLAIVSNAFFPDLDTTQTFEAQNFVQNYQKGIEGAVKQPSRSESGSGEQSSTHQQNPSSPLSNYSTASEGSSAGYSKENYSKKSDNFETTRKRLSTQDLDVTPSEKLPKTIFG